MSKSHHSENDVFAWDSPIASLRGFLLLSSLSCPGPLQEAFSPLGVHQLTWAWQTAHSGSIRLESDLQFCMSNKRSSGRSNGRSQDLEDPSSLLRLIFRHLLQLWCRHAVLIPVPNVPCSPPCSGFVDAAVTPGSPSYAGSSPLGWVGLQESLPTGHLLQFSKHSKPRGEHL